MTVPIEPATDADIAETLWLHENIATDKSADPTLGKVFRLAELAPKLATHLAAFKAAGAEMVTPWNSESDASDEIMRFVSAFAAIRALCGDGPTDLALVPAAELAKERAGHRMICDESEAYERALTAAGVPAWNKEEDRAMGCAERVEWLAAELARPRAREQATEEWPGKACLARARQSLLGAADRRDGDACDALDAEIERLESEQAAWARARAPEPGRGTESPAAARDPDAARLATVHERIATLSGEQRREAMRRLSVSYSAEWSATERGAHIDGDEMVWPDGERYPRRTTEPETKGS